MRLLLVDQNSEYLSEALSDIAPSYLLDQAYNLSDAAYLSSSNDYDLVILGPDTGTTGALDLCKEVRQNTTLVPILMVANEDSLDVKLNAMLAGVDYCLSVSKVSTDLAPVVRALLRKNSQVKADVFEFDGFVVDFRHRRLFYKNEEIFLRRKEFDLLEYLVLHRGITVSKEKLLEHVWKEGIYVLSNTIEVHIKYLRTKLARYSSYPYIRTFKNLGYRFEICSPNQKALS